MSKDMRFEKVADPKRGNFITEIPEGMEFIHADRAEEWVQKIGKRCKYFHKTIDMFSAGEKIFGKRPSSISYGPGRVTYQFEDGSKETVEKDRLKPYYYDKQDDGYLYWHESIGSLEHPYFFIDLVEEGFVSDSDIERMIDHVIDSGETYCAEDLIIILKARRALKEGCTVVCRKD